VAESSLAARLYAFEQQEKGCSWTLQQFEESLDNPLTSCEVYYLESQLAGYLIAMHLGDMFEVLQITVAAAYQRRGVASQLLAACCHKAKDLGCDRVVLEVRETNLKAIALYQKLGFKQDAVRKHYYRNAEGLSEDALLMSLTC
jgi:ribosomal-protein-alanine N-acetyltransferase